MRVSPQGTRSRSARLRLGAALIALLLLATSCSPGGTGDGVTPSGSGSPASSPTLSGDVVADRDEPLVKRVRYPVQGEADPSQNWGDLYLPAGRHPEKSVPLVVLIHGGSWRSGAGAASFDGYADYLVSRGMAVYNIEYRRVGSGGGWPITFTDVADALDFIPELSEEHPEFTTDDELVVGYSAGAQLAAWAGSRDSAEEHELGAHPRFVPTRVLSLAGPLDMTYGAKHGDGSIVDVLGGSPEQVPERYADVDPIQNIDPAVPVVAVHGTADTRVAPENSQRYIEALRERGGRGGLHLLKGETHGSLFDAQGAHHAEILDLIVQTSEAPADQVGVPSPSPG
ncbi:alpha/beta hydrolase family protein [Rothia halotolerans]|uniref:alpha/beta hydrolase family protein n=1 Tax=Rothia halotolerans TaxID=405770 RepID=UPI00101BA974|nr:prolyl oligopeptidase family serine peptidase [Rothia halotolerans]